jgi:hypothetical protein
MRRSRRHTRRGTVPRAHTVPALPLHPCTLRAAESDERCTRDAVTRDCSHTLHARSAAFRQDDSHTVPAHPLYDQCTLRTDDGRTLIHSARTIHAIRALFSLWRVPTVDCRYRGKSDECVEVVHMCVARSRSVRGLWVAALSLPASRPRRTLSLYLRYSAVGPRLALSLLPTLRCWMTHGLPSLYCLL